MDQPVRLNLGAGGAPLEGFKNLDRKTGEECYPLDFPDESVDEIRASHILEHWSHKDTAKVLANWYAKIKPGGCLKVAVPNFEWICEKYQAGEPEYIQGYTMGGHTDQDDFHGAIFDRETLEEAMATVGFERIGHWASDTQDCSSLPVSLNLKGYKPVAAYNHEGVSAILSCPRYGSTTHARCCFSGFQNTRIPYQIASGAYWHHVLSGLMDKHIEDGSEYIITLDYDTVFTAQDVAEIVRLARTFTEADAICGIQMKRGADNALFSFRDGDGKPKSQVPMAVFDPLITQAYAGHFGFTIFRASSLAKLPKPWFVGKPSPEGKWCDGQVDPDIGFWIAWQEAGMKLYLANHVVVGHIQELVTWPDMNFDPIYQHTTEWDSHGIPPEVRR